MPRLQDDAAGAALRQFNEHFAAGVRRGAGGGDEDLAAALAQLEEAAALIEQLPAARRPAARFGIAVRRAEAMLRAGRHERAAAVATQARARAMAEHAWSGLHRVLACIVLWQSLPASEFRAVAAAEREWLFSSEALEAAKYLREPLQILRCELQIAGGVDLPALRRLEQLAHELRTRGENGDWRAWSDLCYQRLARYHLERREYDRAAVWYEELPPAKTAYPRAIIALQRKDYAAAERAGLLLAEGDRAAGLAGDPRCWQLVGDAREAQRRFDEAALAYRKALDAAADAVDRAMALGGLGDCHLGEGRVDDASGCYEQALALLAPSGDVGATAGLLATAQYAETLKDLGRAAEARGDFATALTRHRQALDAVERARAGIPVDLLGGAFLETPLGVGESALLSAVDGVLRACAKSRGGGDVGPGEGEGAAIGIALAAMERGKAREMLEWMRRPPSPGDGEALRRALEDLAVARDGAMARRLRRQVEELRSSAAVRSPVATLAAAELAAALAEEPDTLFLAYWCGTDSGWLVAAQGSFASARLVELGPSAQVLAAEREAIAAVSAAPAAAGASGAAREPWPRLARAAGVLLPAAVRDRIAAAKRVVVCPDATLWQVPFEALPAVGAEPLGIARPVERAPSLSVRAVLRERRSEGVGVVLVGGVVAPAELQERLELAPLRWFSRERELVVAAHGAERVRLLSGAEASFDALRAALAKAPADLVHVSAHAVVSATMPSRTLLVLADGAVPMPTLASLPLCGAELVLSACSSASGEDKGGAGTAGLLWGSLAAGARAVLAPLWPVGQQATADLLGQYHWARAHGDSCAAAMQEARRRLFASPQYAHPFHWAGFTVVAAEPTPANGSDDGTGGSSLPPVLLGFGVVALGAWLLLHARARSRASRTA